jgi:hypothetical protein
MSAVLTGVAEFVKDFVKNLVEFWHYFPEQSKAILSVMVGELIFLSTYDKVGVPSSVVLPVMIGSLIAVAFLFGRIWH